MSCLIPTLTQPAFASGHTRHTGLPSPSACPGKSFAFTLSGCSFGSAIRHRRSCNSRSIPSSWYPLTRPVGRAAGRPDTRVDVLELGIAVGVGTAFSCLAIGLEAITRRLEHQGHGLVADVMALPLQLLGELAGCSYTSTATATWDRPASLVPPVPRVHCINFGSSLVHSLRQPPWQRMRPAGGVSAAA